MRRNIQQIAKDVLEASEVQQVCDSKGTPSLFAKCEYLQEVLLSAGEDLQHIIEQNKDEN